MKYLIIIIGSAICFCGCFSIMTIHGAIQSHSKNERLDVKEAAITQDGVLIINGSHFIDGFSNEKDYSVLIDLNRYLVESKVVLVSGFEPTNFILLPRSAISSHNTILNDKMLRVKVINSNCKDVVNHEIGYSKRKLNYRESVFILCAGQSWGYDEAHYNGWILASDSDLVNNQRKIAFGIEEKKSWPSLGYLLLTPFTLLVDIVTLPVQIIYSFNDNPFR